MVQDKSPDVHPAIPVDVRPPVATRAELEAEDMDNKPFLKGGGIKSGGMMQTFLVSVVAAFLVFMGMGMVGLGNFVTQTNYKTDITNIANTIATIQSQYALKTELGNYVTASSLAAGYATKTELSNYVTAGTLATYATKADLTSATADLSQYVKKTDYDAAVARIKALEDKQATTTSTSTGGITWLVGQQTSYTLLNGVAGSTVSGTLAPSLLFQITNPTTQVEKNIILTITMYAYSFPANWTMAVSSVSATGGSNPLQYSVSSAGNYITIVLWNTISGVDGFKLVAGETVMVSVALNMGYTYVVATPAPITAPAVTLYANAEYTGHS